jgi:ABC-type multidrug transport system fused ATPase/permease subunit
MIIIGLVGLAISYALSLTNLLNSLLSSFIETEKELVSVERIVDYTNNTPIEANLFNKQVREFVELSSTSVYASLYQL